jgi:hypothetical protein
MKGPAGSGTSTISKSPDPPDRPSPLSDKGTGGITYKVEDISLIGPVPAGSFKKIDMPGENPALFLYILLSDRERLSGLFSHIEIRGFGVHDRVDHRHIWFPSVMHALSA